MIPRNDPARAGQPASSQIICIGWRFTIFPVHTRFDRLTWCVRDGNDGSIVGKYKTRENALRFARWIDRMFANKRKENA